MDRGRRASPASSKVLARRWAARERRMHKRKLAEVKSEVDTAPPKQVLSYASRHRKRDMEVEAEMARIERENSRLLKRMVKPRRNPLVGAPAPPARTHALARLRKIELQRISAENKWLLGRLERQRSAYPATAWSAVRREQELLLDSLCEYPRLPSPPRSPPLPLDDGLRLGSARFGTYDAPQLYRADLTTAPELLSGSETLPAAAGRKKRKIPPLQPSPVRRRRHRRRPRALQASDSMPQLRNRARSPYGSLAPASASATASPGRRRRQQKRQRRRRRHPRPKTDKHGADDAVLRPLTSPVAAGRPSTSAMDEEPHERRQHGVAVDMNGLPSWRSTAGSDVLLHKEHRITEQGDWLITATEVGSLSAGGHDAMRGIFLHAQMQPREAGGSSGGGAGTRASGGDGDAPLPSASSMLYVDDLAMMCRDSPLLTKLIRSLSLLDAMDSYCRLSSLSDTDSKAALQMLAPHLLSKLDLQADSGEERKLVQARHARGVPAPPAPPVSYRFVLTRKLRAKRTAVVDSSELFRSRPYPEMPMDASRHAAAAADGADAAAAAAAVDASDHASAAPAGGSKKGEQKTASIADPLRFVTHGSSPPHSPDASSATPATATAAAAADGVPADSSAASPPLLADAVVHAPPTTAARPAAVRGPQLIADAAFSSGADAVWQQMAAGSRVWSDRAHSLAAPVPTLLHGRAALLCCAADDGSSSEEVLLRATALRPVLLFFLLPTNCRPPQWMVDDCDLLPLRCAVDWSSGIELAVWRRRKAVARGEALALPGMAFKRGGDADSGHDGSSGRHESKHDGSAGSDVTFDGREGYSVAIMAADAEAEALAAAEGKGSGHSAGDSHSTAAASEASYSLSSFSATKLLRASSPPLGEPWPAADGGSGDEAPSAMRSSSSLRSTKSRSHGSSRGGGGGGGGSRATARARRKAGAKKEEADAAAQAGRLEDATMLYTAAMKLLGDISDDGHDAPPSTVKLMALLLSCRAGVLQSSGQLHAAIMDCSRALTLDGSQLMPLARRARALEASGRLREAARDYMAESLLLQQKGQHSVSDSSATAAAAAASTSGAAGGAGAEAGEEEVRREAELRLAPLREQLLTELVAAGPPAEAPPATWPTAAVLSDYLRGMLTPALPSAPGLSLRELDSTLAAGESGDLRIARASLQLAAGNAEEAASDLMKASEDEGCRHRAAAVSLLGGLQALAGNIDAARASLRKATDLSPDMASAWLRLAELEHEEGSWEKAAELMERASAAAAATSDNRAVADVLYHRARQLVVQREATEALSLVRKAVEVMRGNFPRALALKARCYLLHGEKEEALRTADEAVALAPDDARIMLARAVALQARHGYAAAEEMFTAALGENGSLVEAAVGLAHALQERDDDANALRVLNNILRHHPRSKLALMARAELHLARGNRASLDDCLSAAAVARSDTELRHSLERLLDCEGHLLAHELALAGACA